MDIKEIKRKRANGCYVFHRDVIDWLIKELDAAQVEIERLHKDWSKQNEWACASAHVVVEAGINHDDLDRCGCEECELV